MSEQYISDQVQRTLRIIRAMAGYEVTGISPSEIAKRAKTTASNVTRILANLEAQQFVQRLPSDNKRYRLGIALVQISNTVTLSINQAKSQLDQDQANYTRIL
jgi:DNA-binding IclR family transcriptional regulator